MINRRRLSGQVKELLAQYLVKKAAKVTHAEVVFVLLEVRPAMLAFFYL
jgi:hypothetical protein